MATVGVKGLIAIRSGHRIGFGRQEGIHGVLLSISGGNRPTARSDDLARDAAKNTGERLSQVVHRVVCLRLLQVSGDSFQSPRRRWPGRARGGRGGRRTRGRGR